LIGLQNKTVQQQLPPSKPTQILPVSSADDFGMFGGETRFAQSIDLRVAASGEYKQRNHSEAEFGLHLWRNILGGEAKFSAGWTYSSIDGYTYDDERKLVPTYEETARFYFPVGSGSFGVGYDNRDGDFKLNIIGVGVFAIIGTEFNIRLNLSELSRQMGW
jgi:hypothetical protein